MDKRKLLTRKPILKVEFNERKESFDVELGKNIESDDVFVALVFAVETLAERLNISIDGTWNQLEVYRKSRKTK